MNQRDRILLSKLNGRVNHLDHADEAAVTQLPAANPTRMASMKGNPPFIGQFTADIFVRYFTVAAGAYTQRDAAYILANAPTLATRLGLFVFSKTDFASGYKKSRQQLPLAVWGYETPFVVGAQPWEGTSFGQFDATVTAQLSEGDMVIVQTAVVGGVNYVGLTILRVQEVGYGTLLDSLSSDMVTINNIRYTLLDTTTAGLAQYRNILFLQTQTLLGLFKADQVPVNAMKQPEQFQNGIVDIPIEKTIDKNIGFSTYVNYDQEDSMSLAFFLASLNKLAA